MFALFGGIYSNYLALEAACRDARSRGVDAIFCLGDLGAFGPHPDRVFPLIDEYKIQCVRGNYDDSIGHELDDCQCGYTDPRDNHFAQISYLYTLENTSPENRRVLRELPSEIRMDVGGLRMLMCHGSARRTNEFLWESTTTDHFLQWMCDAYDADVIAATHSGIKWHCPLGELRHFVNVGVLGRPENDGGRSVWYTLMRMESGRPAFEFIPVDYDYQRLAREMHDEKLPTEFIETITTGWWTTCLEILPSRERRRGRF